MSVDAVQLRSIWLLDDAVAIRLEGLVGGWVSGGEPPAVRNATICMIQSAPPLSGAVDVYAPVAVTPRSWTRSPSGSVIVRFVHPDPADFVYEVTMLAEKSRSEALVVVTASVLLVAPLPDRPEVTSIGFAGSIPEYSTMRMSAHVAAVLKVTITTFAPAAAAAMFAA